MVITRYSLKVGYRQYSPIPMLSCQFPNLNKLLAIPQCSNNRHDEIPFFTAKLQQKIQRLGLEGLP